MSISELELCRSFTAIVDCGSFNAAAEVLGVSQPSLTRRIQRLEAELGTTLIERGPWGIRLTDRGELFYKGAHRILTTVEDVAAEFNRSWGHTVRLGAAATAAGSFLATRLASWLPNHPEVHLIMIEDGAHRMRLRLENRECDIGVIAAPIPSHFASRFIQRVQVQALLPPTHPLATSGEPLSVSELHGVRVLVNGSGFLSTDLLRSACRLANVEPETVYECSVGQTLAALAECCLGIAIMGDSVDLRGFTLPRRNICDQNGRLLSFDLHLAWLGSRVLPPVVLELVEALTDGSTPIALRDRP